MPRELEGQRVAILVANGFEQVEMTEPRKALEQAGAKTDLISPEKKEVQGMNHDEKAEKFPVDRPLDSASPSDYDALLLPGGVANPDRLRMNPAAVKFVQSFFNENKPVAAICHGPWMLVEAGVLTRRTVTSWPSLRTDIRNAGGEWVDREVVRGDGVVTSRKPDDIPAFNREMISLFVESARNPGKVRHA